jgi:hypothetical protein
MATQWIVEEDSAKAFLMDIIKVWWHRKKLG